MELSTICRLQNYQLLINVLEYTKDISQLLEHTVQHKNGRFKQDDFGIVEYIIFHHSFSLQHSLVWIVRFLFFYFSCCSLFCNAYTLYSNRISPGVRLPSILYSGEVSKLDCHAKKLLLGN